MSHLHLEFSHCLDSLLKGSFNLIIFTIEYYPKLLENMIETKRLLIKPLTSEELKLYVNSPKYLASHLGLKPFQSKIEEEPQNAILSDFLPMIEEAGKNYLFYTMWVIIEKSKKAIVGGICFHGEPNDEGEVEIGYGIDTEYRDSGIMTEAIACFVEWIRENLHVNLVRAKTDIGNSPSIKVLERNGFKIYKRIDNSVILKLKLDFDS